MGSRSEGPDKNRDAEGMLTREGVAANKAAKQKQKEQAAAERSLSREKLKDGYLGKPRGEYETVAERAEKIGKEYGRLKGLAKENNITNAQLRNLRDLNVDMGFNPTTGMGPIESFRFRGPELQRDLGSIANVLGKLPTPMNIARQVLGGLTNVGANLKTDFTNTANALSQFQQAPNLGVGIEGLFNNFLASFNPEEETYEGPFPKRKPVNLSFDDALDTEDSYDIRDFLSDAEDTYGVDVTENLYSDSTIENRIPGIFDEDSTAIKELDINRVAPDYSNMMFRPGVNMTQTNYDPVSTSGPNIGFDAATGLPTTISDTGGALTYGDTVYGQEGYDSIIASGGVPVAVTQDMGSYMDKRQGRNLGGRVQLKDGGQDGPETEGKRFSSVLDNPNHPKYYDPATMPVDAPGRNSNKGRAEKFATYIDSMDQNNPYRQQMINAGALNTEGGGILGQDIAHYNQTLDNMNFVNTDMGSTNNLTAAQTMMPTFYATGMPTGYNQGGLIPPIAGPMSNGLGNLFKMK